MAALRWILLGAGLIFLAALAAWELRRPRQGARRGDAALKAPDAAAGSSQAVGPAGPGPGPGPEPDPFHETLHEPFDEALDEMPHQAPHPTTADAAHEIEAASLPLPTDRPVRVQWPPDGERSVLALRIVPGGEEPLSGRSVRQSLGACGFVHGPMQIFHQPTEDGRALLSAASLRVPGTLDPATMDFQRFPGLSLFTVLPGPLDAPAALDHLLHTARDLTQRLHARLQDEQGAPLDATRLESLRRAAQELPGQRGRAEPAA